MTTCFKSRKAWYAHYAGYLPFASLDGPSAHRWICIYHLPPASYWVWPTGSLGRRRVRLSLQHLDFLPARLSRAGSAAITKSMSIPGSPLYPTPVAAPHLPFKPGNGNSLMQLRLKLVPFAGLPLNPLLCKSCLRKQTFLEVSYFECAIYFLLGP